jgi:hypothetical protein
MEKNNDKLEGEDESLDESKDKKSKTSKKDLDSKDSKTKDNPEYESSEKKPEKIGLASFFRKKEVQKTDDEDVEGDEFNEEEPNLTEKEVHEATLVIVDARQQEVSEELNQVEPDSVEEFVALANAVFLEELEENAEQNDDITKDTVDRAYDEAVNDLSVEHNQDNVEIDLEDGDYIESPASPASNANSVAGNYINYNTQTTQATNNVNSGPVHNMAITQNADTITRTETIVEGRRSDMLVGAVIGYIVGRRGGRKRTEKKLQPKITNLEKQVSELHYVITDKEEKIRTLARQKAEEYERRKRQEYENSVSGNNYGNSISDEIIARRLLKTKVKEQLKRRQELSEDPSVEKIGKFSLPALKVFHERRLPDGSENNPSRKQVEVMIESELLEKIDNLFIDGYKVSAVYHKGGLKIESLRQITKEYLRGGPFKETFYREMLKAKHDTESNKESSTSHETEPSKSQNSGVKTKNISLGVLGEEEALKRAEALLLTHTDTKTKSNSSKTTIIVYTILFVIASIFIVVILA